MAGGDSGRDAEGGRDADAPEWRERAVSRRLSAARKRAEQRVQRFIDASLELIDEKNTTDFTIQEVVDRSGQSLRGFYQYFDGKDELLFALFEETVREAVGDIRQAVAGETDPLERLRTFTIRLHEWCERRETPRKRGEHNRLPITEFSWHLAIRSPDRVGTVMTPISRMLMDLITDAAEAGAIKVSDIRHSALLLQQTVMYSWLLSRVVDDPRLQLSAEETWEFCFHGLGG